MTAAPDPTAPDPTAPDPTAAALLPPLWLIVQSYATAVEALMYAELPMLRAKTSPMPPTRVDMIEAVGDPDATEALHWWYENRRWQWSWSWYFHAVATCGDSVSFSWGIMRAKDVDCALTRAIACRRADVAVRIVTRNRSILPRTAMIDAARENNTKLLHLLNRDHADCDELELAATVAEFGDLATLKFAINLVECTDLPEESEIVQRILCGAARSGKLEILEWIKENYDTDLLDGSLAVNNATNVAGLSWIVEHTDYKWARGDCEIFAENGYLELIQFARMQGCPWSNTTAACTQAAQDGYLETLKWMVADGAPYDVVVAWAAAFGNGHTRVVEWIDSHAAALAVALAIAQ